MNRRVYLIMGAVILCIGVFLLIRHPSVPPDSNYIEKISEKDFTTTVSDSLKGGPGAQGGSRQIDLPVRLKISDINNVIGIVTISDILFQSIMVIIVILLIFLTAYFIKAKMNKPVILSPYEKAMKGLSCIDPEKMRPGTDTRELYFLLSRMVQGYLKDSFGLEAKELTATAFSARLDEVAAIPEAARSSIKALILRYDFMKFSGDTVTADDLKKDIVSARELVDALNTALAPKGDSK